MAKALRVVGQIAGAAALVLSVVAPPFAPIAAAVATAANVGAQLLAPKPIARGSPAQVTVDVEPSRPYAVGLVMTGGTIRHDVAYGPTLKKVPNPYRWQVRVLSGVGPINGFVGEYFDFEPISTFYSTGFLSIARQNGNRPEASALSPPIIGTGASPAPGWDASSKLSGCAAVGLNMRFDKDGERYASGIPVYTALIEGEKVYDPRLDSTFPGGSGPCRAGIESTYVYSRNPACHAVTYALGRFQNGIRVFGLGQPADTLDMAAIVDWANDCDANGWTVNMVLREGGTGANLREQRVRNLDDLCAAGGARWYQAGGLLSFDWHRPRLSLATLTDEDILVAGGGTDAAPTVRDRMNGIRPQYVSPAHNWQQITAAEIIGTTYRTEDGEKLTQVYPLNGVTDAAQAGELAAYAMADSREIGPIDLQAKAKWRFYRPGDCITIDSSLAAYQGQAIINQRSLNPQTLAVSLSLKSETPGKHAFALGKVAVPPPTPVLAQTNEERDLLASAALAPRADDVADAVAPANSNRVPYSRMEGDRGWAVLFNPAALVNSPFFGTFENRRIFGVGATATSGGQTFSIGSNILMRVTALERLSVQARLDVFDPAAIGGSWVFRAVFRNAAGAATFATVASGSGVVSAASIASGFIDVPAGQVSMTLELVAVSGAAGAWTIAISEPMVTSAAPGQTVHPPFTPGPNASDGADPNNLITVDSNGILNGTGTVGVNVDNRRAALQGLLSARPASGQFIGQEYHATDTREIYQWDGFNWRTSADITATAQRSIEPQFPSIEIKQGEAGHTGNRTVTHTAKRGTSTLTGGTWSLVSTNLGAGSASINSGTGTVTLSGIVQSGAYIVRYTHTDGIQTDFPVNVTYVPTPPSGTVSAKTGATTSNTGVGNTNAWSQVISLVLSGAPAGRVFFNNFSLTGGNRLRVNSGTGTCEHQARLLINGSVVATLPAQPTVTSGTAQFIDFSGLFQEAWPVSAGTVTIAVELQRTSGTGTIATMSNSLDVNIFAS